MEIRQLKYFVATAESLNFSEAAKRNYVTQSTLSQQIKQLENEMGVQLFERNNRSVFLTEAGKELLPFAIDAIHAVDNCQQRIMDLQHFLTGTLNIGVTYSFSPIVMESIFTFMERFPKVKLNVYHKSVEELMEMLHCRKVDFVLSFKPSVINSEVESQVIFENHLSAIVNSNHPLASKDIVELSDLERYDLALPSHGFQSRSTFEELQAQHKNKFRVRIELNDANILLKIIKQSEMVTILSESSIHNLDGFKAIPINCLNNKMEVCIHILKDTYRKKSLTEFIEILNNSNAVMLRKQGW